ncbi:hypothetical protein AB1Y20_011160 [Prymnesium parvum]|uniref:Mitochondrial carrier protein n=1 Tax=Prymnesium parvum TaxID=97485 RepID=A0AB34ILS5_PRYPA
MVADQLKTLVCTATSCCVADGLCLPLDFLKTRMQLQNELVPRGAPKLGVFAMSARVVRTEGLLAFYNGFPAAMLRQASYGGLCFASYPYIRDALNPNAQAKDAPLWTRLAAGALAGGFASALANPTDVVKVRLQADGRLKLEGGSPRYTGTAHAFASIWKAEGGLRAFYKGCLPNVQRAVVVNGAGIAAYDHSKQTAQRLLGEGESLTARFVAALIGGLTTTFVGCPFDVLKTRMMNQHQSKPLYSSVLDCARSIVRVEGVTALWKGVLPVYVRQAPFNMLNYLIMEHLTKALMGKSVM